MASTALSPTPTPTSVSGVVRLISANWLHHHKNLSLQLQLQQQQQQQTTSVICWRRKKQQQQQLKRRNNHHLKAAASFDFSPPPIDHDLLDTLRESGAKVSEDGVTETFHNDDEALDAAHNAVAIVDLSHFGRIRVSGEDRIQFLHNQTTANFESLNEGEGCDTVFVTPTARTIDIAHAWIMKNAVMLVVSPETCSTITEMLAKYIFFADKVEVQDVTKETCLFGLMGPNCNQVMKDLNLADPVGQPYGAHKHYSVNGMPLTVGVGNLMSEEGFTLLMSTAAARTVWKTLKSHGAIPMGSNAWEKLRILRGRPAPGKELTNDYNVLEAGLWNAISTDKGCYKGQETISRLITYDGVKQKLWGIRMSGPANPGSTITYDGKRVGTLTSCVSIREDSENFGLGYIKRQASSVGSTVIVADTVKGTLVEVPFLAWQRPPEKSSSS